MKLLVSILCLISVNVAARDLSGLRLTWDHSNIGYQFLKQSDQGLTIYTLSRIKGTEVQKTLVITEGLYKKYTKILPLLFVKYKAPEQTDLCASYYRLKTSESKEKSVEKIYCESGLNSKDTEKLLRALSAAGSWLRKY